MTLNFRGERPIYFSPQTIILDGKKIFISGEKLYKLLKVVQVNGPFMIVIIFNQFMK